MCNVAFMAEILLEALVFPEQAAGSGTSQRDHLDGFGELTSGWREADRSRSANRRKCLQIATFPLRSRVPGENRGPRNSRRQITAQRLVVKVATSVVELTPKLNVALSGDRLDVANLQAEIQEDIARRLKEPVGVVTA